MYGELIMSYKLKIFVLITIFSSAGLIFLKCGQKTPKYDAIYLSITSDLVEGGLKIASISLKFMKIVENNQILVVPEDPNDPAYNFPVPAVLDITEEPFIVKIIQGTKFTGEVFISAQGIVSGEVKSSAIEKVNISDNALISIHLSSLTKTCDADQDGYKACSVAGCCSEAEKNLNDCDDTNPLVHPFQVEDPCEPCSNTVDDDCLGGDAPCTDKDGDGFPDCGDCNPGDNTVYKGAQELCDKKDNDCDGLTDEELTYIDWNKSIKTIGQECGTGECEKGKVECDEKTKKPICSTDINKVSEICDDGKDNNCNGFTDEGCLVGDIDGDGVDNSTEDMKCGNLIAKLHSEIVPENTGKEPCCPADADKEICDRNCDGKVTTCDPNDKDFDGFTPPSDCDDKDPLVYPGAYEKCGDGIDQDCFGGDKSCNGVTDEDGDGFSPPDDCNDKDPEINPWADEWCDGIDNNCNGIVDEGNPEANDEECGSDVGECNKGILACVQMKGGNTALQCIGAIDPADEVCDGKDNDCNSKTDEIYFYNGIAIGSECDGEGECGTGTVECTCGKGIADCEPYEKYATCSTDPDGSAKQNAVETCNNKDDDCDGLTDEDLYLYDDSSCLKQGVCLTNKELILVVCVNGKWICDYTKVPAYEPDDEKTCDGLDNDCDGYADDEFSFKDWNMAVKKKGDLCGTGVCKEGKVICSQDKKGLACSTASKTSDEICDGFDNNCNGQTDENQLYAGKTVYFDPADVSKGKNSCDGVGECGAGLIECNIQNKATCSTDVDGSAHGEEGEMCDNKDNDCNGETDDGLNSIDISLCLQTGVCKTDIEKIAFICIEGVWICDYDDVAGYEAHIENSCDELDNDCDSETDEDFTFKDWDGTEKKKGEACGTGECKNGTVVCTEDKSGLTCSTLFKSSEEVCDGIDNDCNGLTDENQIYQGKTVYVDPSDTTKGQNECDGIGECGVGTVECNLQKKATCSTDIDGTQYPNSVEICDNKDNNCNGFTDENLTNLNDSTCRKVGVCKDTAKALCKNGNWTCDYSAVPSFQLDSETLCDAKDNDCDGSTDEDMAFKDWNGQEKKKNWTCGTGACADGTVICSEKFEITCSFLTKKSDEVCDGIDNDCNGQTDENQIYDGKTVYKDTYDSSKGKNSCDGVGECGTGTVECNSAKKATCSTNIDGTQYPNVKETCNNKDDDCDGMTDEELTNLNDSTCRKVGLCKDTAKALCKSGAWVCDYSTVADFQEDFESMCDALDNDCDGSTDEDMTYKDWNGTLKKKSESCGTGACSGGTAVCETSTKILTCSTLGNISPEICDKTDNDCDGVTDDGQLYDGHKIGEQCDGVGECGIGFVECNVISKKPTCSTNPDGSAYVYVAEACNKKDDDCNGFTDEETDALCADTKTCTDDFCSTAGSCSNPTKPGWCLISGSCITDKALKGKTGDAQCSWCDYTKKQDDWSLVPNGEKCDDGLANTYNDICTNGVCAGTSYTCNDGHDCTDDTHNGDGKCTFTIQSQKCLINETCYGDGDDNPQNQCQECVSNTSKDSWTNKGTSATCNDGNLCTYTDLCNGNGTCAGTAYACNDSLNCTTDACTGVKDGCTYTTITGWCRISGVCYARGTRQDAVGGTNQCKVCDDTSNNAAWSSNTGLTCNDNNDCTYGDICTSGACGGTSYSCNDSKDCTTDACHGTGASDCTHTVNTNTCFINNSCYNEGVDNPQNECQECVSATSKVSWTNKGITATCNDGNLCTHTDLCNGSGTCTGTAYTCSDSLNCTSDACTGVPGGCTFTTLTGWCKISGVCYARGTRQDAVGGANQCKVCDDTSNNAAWSNNTGFTCNDNNDCTYGDICTSGACGGTSYSCNDGFSCTTDACHGTGASDCTHTVNSSTCYINNKCYDEGNDNPQNECQECVSATSKVSWTNKGTSATCNDGNLCTHTDLCNGSGTCAGTSYTCNDSLSCTSDACTGAPGGCTFTTLTGWCKISSVCYARGTRQDAVGGTNQCKVCDDLSNNAAWSSNTGFTCNDNVDCTYSDTCTAGVCGGTSYSCNDSLSCTTDACHGTGSADCTHTISSGCLINNICRTEGFDNPDNQCQECVSATSKTAWTNKGNTTSCIDGNACTSNDLCNNGICTGTPNGCDDSLSCTSDGCNGGSCFHQNTCSEPNPACMETGGTDTCKCKTISGSSSVVCSAANSNHCYDGVCYCGLDSQAECNDGKSCTTDACLSASCTHTNTCLQPNPDCQTAGCRCGTTTQCDSLYSNTCTSGTCYCGSESVCSPSGINPDCKSSETQCKCCNGTYTVCNRCDSATANSCATDGSCKCGSESACNISSINPDCKSSETQCKCCNAEFTVCNRCDSATSNSCDTDGTCKCGTSTACDSGSNNPDCDPGTSTCLCCDTDYSPCTLCTAGQTCNTDGTCS
jgi:hypothetical protein